MSRVAVFLMISTLIASALLLGCGGEKGTSSKPTKSFIRFENKFYCYGVEDMTIHVIIEACNQDFWMERDDVRVVECVPEDESTSFEVVIEAGKPIAALQRKEPQREVVTVSAGQTVTITGELYFFKVDVHD